MSDSLHSDDLHLAGLVLAATAAADEEGRTPHAQGKRRRDDEETHLDGPYYQNPIDQTSSQTAPANGPSLHSSASVLFREPSMTSRKYSRPPLGKVFTSLQLAPENFLRLQTAAKAFMLDEAHLERRDVVGHQKQSGAADVAKLNLWNCVEDFLSTHGYGEKYFAPGVGGDIPDAPARTLSWPADRQTIIKLMMPLMRKMVTNERQRVYAAESRKSTGTKEDEKPDSNSPNKDESPRLDAAGTGPLVSPAPAAAGTGGPPLPSTPSPISATNGHVRSSPPFKPSIAIHVNVVSSNVEGARRRVIPRFTLQPETTPNLSALISHAKRKHPGGLESDSSMPVVKVWLPDGLVTVADDREWMVALLSAGVVDWMDGEVRVLVEV
ncbi:hypothetical protein PV10_07157 [Exophiala mesophila]|uniref:Uncharacterized protein n=1 Tax=Exophiala mesophila TaxID=212818 RepID=A0A0D1Z779_EXOME|nr:uncharacterized protein PV10_07157 [Exophiala mesophila]KIV89779.1 hypothetical protein PV10_07157 [Exophiala mesophila]